MVVPKTGRAGSDCVMVFWNLLDLRGLEKGSEDTSTGKRLVFLNPFCESDSYLLCDCFERKGVTRTTASLQSGKRDAWMDTLTGPDEIGHSDGGTHLTILALYLNSGVHAHANCRNGATKM